MSDEVKILENETNEAQDQMQQMQQMQQNHSGGGGGGGSRGGARGRRFGRGRDDSRGGRGDQAPHMENEPQELIPGAGRGGYGGRGGRGSRFRGGGGGGGGMGGGMGMGMGMGMGGREERAMRNQDDRLNERLSALAAPTVDLPPQDNAEKKFSGRCRLYVGNLTNDVTEEEMQALFQPYGETSELFVNKEKNFAFIRLDYRANAEKAKRELDGSLRKGRPLKVRFAPHSACIKVKNLTPWVTNELLERAFSVFGEADKAAAENMHRSDNVGFSVEKITPIRVTWSPRNRISATSHNHSCTDSRYYMVSSWSPITDVLLPSLLDTRRQERGRLLGSKGKVLTTKF
ncbi:hypothetical protein PR048_022331 [Dryococelus australis]|uniref:RRM domain-containing protein n=1 Tax=Dryococelus australis TaxID=614101 RepID=A0ABQ9H0T1_9NEOP|nr:hypothetical protein PR048_022331 [Dryococelus australis]